MKEKRKLNLPEYTLAEELINSISHGIGALLGVAAVVLCVVISVLHKNVWGVVSGAIYGGTLVILYTMSSIYHALKRNRAKVVFRTFDHCSIFLLIAGTYTPITLVSLRGPIGWTLFGVVWAAAITGIALNGVSVEKFKVMSMICYIAMGWAVVFAFPLFRKAVAPGGVALLLWGGVLYTIGAVIYMFGKKAKFIHSLWHFFVLGGSILHFFSIYLYIL